MTRRGRYSHSRHKGKQFVTKSGTSEPFSKFTHYLRDPNGKVLKSDAYDDTTGYLKAQPLETRKLGFGSHQCKNRDEFSSTLRTERYRAQLKAELKLTHADRPTSAALETIRARRESILARTAALRTGGDGSDEDTGPPPPPAHMYDIGRTSVTEPCPKCPRDTFHCPHRCASSGSPPGRRLGGASLSSMEVGSGAHDLSDKSHHVRVAITKSFYNIGHAELG